MKLDTCLIIAMLVSVLITGSRAGETNVIFVQDQREIQMREVLFPVQTNEFLPAELDPDGHWGKVVIGFQLSIRSTTNVFTVGERVPLAVILRNTTTNGRSGFDIADGAEVDLVIENKSNQVRHSFNPSDLRFSGLGGLRQIRHDYNYNMDYWDNATPGLYRLHAEQKVFDQSPVTQAISNITNVSSGVFLIKIVPK